MLVLRCNDIKGGNSSDFLCRQLFSLWYIIKLFEELFILIREGTMDCSPPGSSVQGILQARILEWVAMLSSRASSRSRDQTHVSYVSSTGRGFLTTSATWQALSTTVWYQKKVTHPAALTPNFAYKNFPQKNYQGFLSTSQLFLLSPAVNLSRLQTLTFQFIWPHCALGWWTWTLFLNSIFKISFLPLQIHFNLSSPLLLCSSHPEPQPFISQDLQSCFSP